MSEATPLTEVTTQALLDELHRRCSHGLIAVALHGADHVGVMLCGTPPELAHLLLVADLSVRRRLSGRARELGEGDSIDTRDLGGK